MRKFAVLCWGLALLASADGNAAAEEAGLMPLLKPDVEIASELVTIGDLFDHAGLYAEKAVFRAPDIGTRGTVEAAEIANAVRAAGLKQFDLGGLTEVMVTRASLVVGTEEIEAAVTAALAEANGLPDPGRLSLTFDVAPQPIHVSPHAQKPVTVTGLSYSRASGRFEAVVIPALPKGQNDGIRLAGTAVENVEVPVLTRTLGRGDVVSAGDVTLQNMPRNRAPRDTVAGVAEIIGLAARRPMAIGTPVKTADFNEPYLVERNDLVTILFEAPGITLSARGRVLDNGTKGGVVAVRNIQSKRTIQATVTGYGTVTVANGRARLAGIIGGIQ